MSTCTKVVHQRRQGFYSPCLVAASWPYLVMQDEAALCRSGLVVSTFTHESKEKWEAGSRDSRKQPPGGQISQEAAVDVLGSKAVEEWPG